MPVATRRKSRARATSAPRGAPRVRSERRPRRTDELTAFDVMTRRIVTVAPDTTLSEVARVLSENQVSGVPVVNTRGKAIGVVSLRDIVDRAVEDPDAGPRKGRTYFRLSTEELLDEDFEDVDVPQDTEDKAEDVMNPEVISIRADASVREVAATMARRSVHRLLVTEPGTGAVIGIVGSLSVLAALGRR